MSKNDNESKKKTATKMDLIKCVAKRTEIHSDDAKQIIQLFLDKIIATLAKKERIEFRDFGVFKVVERKQKIGRNPKRAEVPIVIPARSTVKFIIGKKINKLLKS